jgi:hypothetical protein
LAEQKAEEQRRMQERWQAKLRSSPFTVNLVAETERLEEEHQVRVQAEERRRAAAEARALAAKQEIILRALQEDSDLDALRREKRAIAEEERRLKARTWPGFVHS